MWDVSASLCYLWQRLLDKHTEDKTDVILASNINHHTHAHTHTHTHTHTYKVDIYKDKSQISVSHIKTCVLFISYKTDHLLIPAVFINLWGLSAEINENWTFNTCRYVRLLTTHERIAIVRRDDKREHMYVRQMEDFIRRPAITCERHVCVKPIKCCRQTDIWRRRLCSPLRTRRSCTPSRCRCSRRESEEPSRWSDAADAQK